MHELLKKYTFIRSSKVYDRLFERPDDQKIQQREHDKLELMQVPDVSDIVSHLNGGPDMIVDSFEVHQDDGNIVVECSWWDQIDGRWNLRREGFDHRVLRIKRSGRE